MKKFIFIIFTLATLFVSCEKYCPYCDGYGCDYCGVTRTLTYTNDYFCAEKLLGTWQCDYDNYVGNMLLKEIKFLSSKKCDIIYSIGRNTEWYTDTFNYSYSGSYIKFSNNGTAFSYRIDGFIFPELYVRDSFGKYTWKKVRSYGC